MIYFLYGNATKIKEILSDLININSRYSKQRGLEKS